MIKGNYESVTYNKSVSAVKSRCKKKAGNEVLAEGTLSGEYGKQPADYIAKQKAAKHACIQKQI